MPKTKEFTIICTDIRVSPNNGRYVSITVEEPDMIDVFNQLEEDDIIDYVKSNIAIHDIYDSDTLEEWAEKNGYSRNLPK